MDHSVYACGSNLDLLYNEDVRRGLDLDLEVKFYWSPPWPRAAWPLSSVLGLELNEAKAKTCDV